MKEAKTEKKSPEKAGPAQTTAVNAPPEVRASTATAQKEVEQGRQTGASPVGRTSTAEHGHFKASAPVLVPENGADARQPAQKPHHQHHGGHANSSRLDASSQQDNGSEAARDPRNYK